MGEPRQTPSTNPANPPTSEQTRETSRTTEREPTRTTEREETRPTRSTTPSGQKCEVLKDSCKNDAKFKVTFPSGSNTYCCAEHKQTVVDNYPDQELVFEELGTSKA